MYVTTKELRIQPGRILDQVANGDEITVTFRGRPVAKIIPIRAKGQYEATNEESIFGMWSSHNQEEHVEDAIDAMRKGREF